MHGLILRLRKSLRRLESCFRDRIRLAGSNLWLVLLPDMAKLQQAISILFEPEEYESAVLMLDDFQIDRCPVSLYLKLAAVRCSGGSLQRLEDAIEMGNQDFRELLLDAGFEGTNAHLRWVPRPFHQRDADH